MRIKHILALMLSFIIFISAFAGCAEQTAQPIKPDAPVDEPNEPETPDAPVEPDEPSKPDEPVKPDEPDTPDEPYTPDEPDTPDEPSKPDEPVTPPHTHQWDNGRVTKEATCGSEGVKTFTCDCGEIKTEAISISAEHSWSDGVIEGSFKLFICAVCKSTKYEELPPPPPPAGDPYIVVANHRWSVVSTGELGDNDGSVTVGLDGINYNRFNYKALYTLAEDGHILAVKKSDIADYMAGKLDDSKTLSLAYADEKSELIGTEIYIEFDGDKVKNIATPNLSVVGKLEITKSDGKYTVKVGNKTYLENADGSNILASKLYSYAYTSMAYFSAANKLRVFISPATFVDLNTIYSNAAHNVSEVENFYNEFYALRRTNHQVTGYDWDHDGKLDMVILNDGTTAKVEDINDATIGLGVNGTNAGYCGHGYCTHTTYKINDITLNCTPIAADIVIAYGDYKTGQITVEALTEVVGILTAIDWNNGTCVIDGITYEICIGGETPYGYAANKYRWASKNLDEELLGNKIKVLTDGKYIVRFVETAVKKILPLADDSEFYQKNIFTSELYKKGITYTQTTPSYYTATFNSKLDSYAIILPVTLGKLYEVRFDTLPKSLGVFHVDFDPSQQSNGTSYTLNSNILFLKTPPVKTLDTDFMHIPQKDEYLVIVTGNKLDDVYIGEQTIVAEGESNIDWWIPEEQGSIRRGDSNLMGDIDWTSEEFIDNMYEPVRKAHPKYITRSVIGKDQSGKYNMYRYVYTPDNYKITLLLSSGIHGDEEASYFALARIMNLIANATEKDTHLYFLKQNVRFVVIPLINPWGVSQAKNTRTNSSGIDLNRDFFDMSQQESINFIAALEEYADTASMLIDFHCAGSKGKNNMFYNFQIQEPNAPTIFRTLNQLHHRQMELGYVKELQALEYIPGPYIWSGSRNVDTKAYNYLGVPSMTAEHFINGHNFPATNSAESMTHAVEAFGNMIIQNAYFFVGQASK